MVERNRVKDHKDTTKKTTLKKTTTTTTVCNNYVIEISKQNKQLLATPTRKTVQGNTFIIGVQMEQSF